MNGTMYVTFTDQSDPYSDPVEKDAVVTEVTYCSVRDTWVMLVVTTDGDVRSITSSDLALKASWEDNGIVMIAQGGDDDDEEDEDGA